MRAVVVIFTALLVGGSYGQSDESIFDVDMPIRNEESRSNCGANKVCVPPSLCVNGEININGVGLLGPRFGSSACDVATVCCALKDQTAKHSSPMTAPKCGVRNIGGIERSRRSEQNVADFGEFPWILRLTGTKSKKVYGGGSLIHPQIALTAAHIVANAAVNDISVYADEWMIDSTSEPLPHQTRTVSEKVQHELFDSRRLRYDITLLFLSHPFDLEPHIGTVCLPPPNFDIDLITCYATGWGEDRVNSRNSLIPKKIDLPIEENSACQLALRNTRLTRHFRLHQSFMCAGGEADKDACYGDGGSPLVCPIEGKRNKYHQVGIVSWGIDCGIQDVPGVYASVPYLRSWVDEKVTQRNFETSFYTYM